jgi:hypothetical protein
MQLIINGFRDFIITGHTVYLVKTKQQLQIYSKRKKFLLLTILLVLPLGVLWVYLIIEADKKYKKL